MAGCWRCDMRTRCCAAQVGRVCYQPGDRLWLAGLSRLIPRHRWGVVFADGQDHDQGVSGARGDQPASDLALADGGLDRLLAGG